MISLIDLIPTLTQDKHEQETAERTDAQKEARNQMTVEIENKTGHNIGHQFNQHGKPGHARATETFAEQKVQDNREQAAQLVGERCEMPKPGLLAW